MCNKTDVLPGRSIAKAWYPLVASRAIVPSSSQVLDVKAWPCRSTTCSLHREIHFVSQDFITDQTITIKHVTCSDVLLSAYLGNICRPAPSTGNASLKNSGGSPGSCPVRIDTLMVGSGGGGVAMSPILWASRDGSMLPWRMDGSSRYSSNVANNTRPRTTRRLRKKFIVSGWII